MRALVVLALAGCFKPSPPEGQACGPERWCPPPLTCAADDTCRSTASRPDGGEGDPEAGQPDADSSGANLAFVSSMTLSPKALGPPEMADARCTTIAHAAGRPGNFIAWISVAGNAAATRLGAARGWLRADGKPFVDSRADLVAGTMYYPLRLDENNTERMGLVMTGTTDAGEGGGEDCLGFTSTNPGELLLAGSTESTTRRWTNDTEVMCDGTFRYYCLQIDHDFALPKPSDNGPRVFLSLASFDARTGLAAADALCVGEAQTAGLPGTYVALLATTTASAVSRAGGAGVLPWVRADGIAVSRDFARLDAPISVTAKGVHVDDGVWFGARNGTALAADGAESCDDWAATGTTGLGGTSSRSNSDAFSGTGIPCNSPRRIYCAARRN